MNAVGRLKRPAPGEKVAINGGLNLSILTVGSWSYDGTNGFMIGNGFEGTDVAQLTR